MKNGTQRLSSGLIFISLFALTYLFIALCFWVYVNYVSYAHTVSEMNRYMIKNKQVLEKTLFDEIFTNAEACLSLRGTPQEQCYEEISHRMAKALIEKEFNDRYSISGYFSFLRRKGDRYDKLGWDGRRVDVSHIVRKSPLHIPIPQFLKLLMRSCHYTNTEKFSVRNISGVCEVYTSMKLNDDAQGFIMSKVSLTEETFILFSVLFPLIELSILPVVKGATFSYYVTNILIILSFILIPLIVARVGVHLYQKKK